MVVAGYNVAALREVAAGVWAVASRQVPTTVVLVSPMEVYELSQAVELRVPDRDWPPAPSRALRARPRLQPSQWGLWRFPRRVT